MISAAGRDLGQMLNATYLARLAELAQRLAEVSAPRRRCRSRLGRIPARPPRGAGGDQLDRKAHAGSSPPEATRQRPKRKAGVRGNLEFGSSLHRRRRLEQIQFHRKAAARHGELLHRGRHRLAERLGAGTGFAEVARNGLVPTVCGRHPPCAALPDRRRARAPRSAAPAQRLSPALSGRTRYLRAAACSASMRASVSRRACGSKLDARGVMRKSRTASLACVATTPAAPPPISIGHRARKRLQRVRTAANG